MPFVSLGFIVKEVKQTKKNKMKYQEYAIDQKIERPDGSFYLYPLADGRNKLILQERLISSLSNEINNGRYTARLLIFGFTPSWQKLQVAEFDINFEGNNYKQTAKRIVNLLQ